MAKKTTHQSLDFDLQAQDPMQVNVRYDADSGCLRPVGFPATAGEAQGEVIGVMRAGDREIVISAADGEVTLTPLDGSAATTVGVEGETPTVAVTTGSGVMLSSQFSGDGPVMLTVNEATGAATVTGRLPRTGAPRLVRVDDGPVVVALPQRNLTGTYSRTDTALTPADIHTLSTDYTDAYCAACNRASARGRYIQPVIARITARDAAGVMLYRSAPVMIAPDAGPGLLKVERALSGDDLNVVERSTMQAVPFSIGVVIPADMPQQWRRRVATIEVETTPQLHAVNFSMPSGARINRPASGAPSLTLSAPGTDVAVVHPAGDGSELCRRVEALLSIGDEAFSTARTLPCDTTGVTNVYRRDGASCREEVASLGALASRSASCRGADNSVSLNYPHSFSAGCGTCSGGLVMWGDVTVKRFTGYSVAEMMVTQSTSAQAMPATAVVTLSDGRQLVDSTTLTSAIPSSLSPLMMYPHPSAVKITIIAGTRKWESALRPTPCGRMAYCLAADMKPVVPGEELGMHVVPQSSVVTERRDGLIAVAREHDPLRVEAVMQLGATVTAIEPQVRAGSTLDVTRRHFYVFTRGGIASVTAAGSKITLSASVLDHRGVMTARSVAPMPDGVIAVAGGDLVKLSGGKVATMLVNVGACTVGYSARRGEIWLFDGSEGETMAYNPSTRYGFLRNDVEAVDALTTSRTLLLVLDDGSILDAATEKAVTMKVKMQFRLGFKRAAAVTALGVKFYGTSIKGNIALAADNGIHSPDGAYRIVDFDVDGTLARPLEARVIASRYRYATLGINAIISPDARMEGGFLGL